MRRLGAMAPALPLRRGRLSHDRRVWALTTLAVLLGSAVAAGPARPHSIARARLTTTGETGEYSCKGRARRLRPRQLGFSFTCEGADVTAFELRANRALHAVIDPTYAFGCERRTSRYFYCEDIHSGAGEVGSGVATVSEPFCHAGARLVLRITPGLDFESRARKAFTLKGPC
jgi:hypothetical protein